MKIYLPWYLRDQSPYEMQKIETNLFKIFNVSLQKEFVVNLFGINFKGDGEDVDDIENGA